MKRLFALLLAAALTLGLCGCGPRAKADDGRLQVVCTVFPQLRAHAPGRDHPVGGRRVPL